MFQKTIDAKDTLLIMALPMESQGLFEKAGITVHYCGIGKVNAAIMATQLIVEKKPKVLLNFGTAGSHKFKTHELLECLAYEQRDMDLSPLGLPRGQTPMDEIPGRIEFTKWSNLPSAVCGTGDSFEVGPPKLDCDIVDMEAFAIAKTCKKLGVDFISLKYITDGSDHNAYNDWQKNLLPGAQTLLAAYQQLVK